jgi:hypothetical protein
MNFIPRFPRSLAFFMSTPTTMIRPLCRHRAITVLSRVNGLERACSIPRQRQFATAVVDDSTLPLKGYRVLDMTRVLAGVSWRPGRCGGVTNKLGAAILYSNTWRSWVRLIQNHPTYNTRPAYPFCPELRLGLL